MTTTHDMTTAEMVNALRARRWSDAAIGKELGVSAVAVYRWRTAQRGRAREAQLTRRALIELLERP